MGLHERAWEGLELMVFGSTPTLPMRIEQSLANASPNNEVRIASYEKYEDAYDYCKKARDVGIIIITENCGALPFDQVFRELGKLYEARGMPCFGYLLHENEASFIGRRTIATNKKILDYLDVSELLDPQKAPVTLNAMWEKFSEGFESHLMPNPLKETLLAILGDSQPLGPIQFENRVASLLMMDLNVSWLETVSIRWNPLISRIHKTLPAALIPHQSLVAISKVSEPDSAVTPDKSLSDIISNRTTPLAKRLTQVIRTLEAYREAGRLEESLKALGTQSKPGAPAMLRHLVKHRDRILTFAHEQAKSQDNQLAVAKAMG